VAIKVTQSLNIITVQIKILNQEFKITLLEWVKEEIKIIFPSYLIIIKINKKELISFK